MILVTGSTGQFGSSTIEYLLTNGISSTNIVALVREKERATSLKEKGITLRVGDYEDKSSLINAFQGIEKLLFVSGSDVLRRSAQHQNVVEAAKEAGVQHIIYTSFQGNNETESSAIWLVAESHLKTEFWLKESGISYTILKNSLYMDFIPAFIGENVLNSGMIFFPAETGKVGAVLRSELAEATANIICGSNHEGKTYCFTNLETFSYKQIADHLSFITGKKITYLSPTPDEYKKTLTEYGVPIEYISLFSSFAVAQANGELDTVSSDLNQILGRKPTGINTFLNQVYSNKK